MKWYYLPSEKDGNWRRLYKVKIGSTTIAKWLKTSGYGTSVPDRHENHSNASNDKYYDDSETISIDLHDLGFSEKAPGMFNKPMNLDWVNKAYYGAFLSFSVSGNILSTNGTDEDISDAGWGDTSATLAGHDQSFNTGNLWTWNSSSTGKRNNYWVTADVSLDGFNVNIVFHFGVNLWANTAFHSTEGGWNGISVSAYLWYWGDALPDKDPNLAKKSNELFARGQKNVQIAQENYKKDVAENERLQLEKENTQNSVGDEKK